MRHASTGWGVRDRRHDHRDAALYWELRVVAHGFTGTEIVIDTGRPVVERRRPPGISSLLSWIFR